MRRGAARGPRTPDAAAADARPPARPADPARAPPGSLAVLHSPSDRVVDFDLWYAARMSSQPGHREFMKRKSKAAIKQHWTDAGRWSEFVDAREYLKGEGHPPEEAWFEADRLLQEGWSPEPTDTASSSQPPQSGDSSPSGGVSLPASTAGRDSFKAETASIAETVRWVASFLMVNDASPEDAPSAEAWAMLQWARRNNANEAAFWGQIWRQLMPTKQALEAETRFNDDGRPILDLISRIQSATGQDDQSLRINTEGSDGES